MKAVNLLLPLSLLPVLSAARAESPLPDAVERAIAEAEARAEPQQRWAFTRTYTRNGDTIVARYDPRRQAREQWRLTTPPSSHPPIRVNDASRPRRRRTLGRALERELHPGPKGYEVSARAVKESLTQLMAAR